MLQRLIEQRYEQLGGLTELGRVSSGFQGEAGLNTGTNISNLLLGKGTAQAGSVMAQGMAQSMAFNDLIKLGTAISGAGGITGLAKSFWGK
jgi:hypothetical protein